jgi:hypothetical protein
MAKATKRLPRKTRMSENRNRTVRTVDEAAAAYGGMPELIKAFGLTMAKGRANSIERWQLTGVPCYHHLGLYLGLQYRGYEATPELFGARSWEEVPGISASSRVSP